MEVSTGVALVSIVLFFVKSVFGVFVALPDTLSDVDLSNTQDSAYHIEVKNAYASCFIHEIVDSEGNVHYFSDEVEEALDCPFVLAFSNDDTYLVYEYENDIKAYDVETEETRVLYEIPEDIDGISNVFWDEAGSLMGFVEINQHEYPETTRLVVIDWEEAVTNNSSTLIQPQTYDIKVRFSCGSVCMSSVGEDIWFSDESTVSYLSYENDPYEDITAESVQTLSL